LNSESPVPDLDGKLIQIEDTTYRINTAEPDEMEEHENSSDKGDANGHGK
jgi:hypothetical protein